MPVIPRCETCGRPMKLVALPPPLPLNDQPALWWECLEDHALEKPEEDE